MNNEIWIEKSELRGIDGAETELPELLLYKKGIYCCVDLSPVKGRKSWQCPRCGNQFYPSAGTILHKSTTTYTIWYLIIDYLLEDRNTRLCEIYNSFLINIITYQSAHRIYHLVKSRVVGNRINVAKSVPFVRTKRQYLRTYTKDTLMSQLVASEIF